MQIHKACKDWYPVSGKAYQICAYNEHDITIDVMDFPDEVLSSCTSYIASH